jgi:hypothetical protein
MDGQPMLDAFVDIFTNTHLPQSITAHHTTSGSTTLSADEEAEIQKRLQDLGYLG